MRARNIKPDFFIDEDLSELPFETRILFIGLWCAADRDGRLEDRPKRLKAQIFPFDAVNIDEMLAQLHKSGHIIRYSDGGLNILQVKNFAKHQAPHHTERASILPCFNGESLEFNGEAPDIHASCTVEIPLIPDSGFLIPDRGLRSSASKPAPLYRWDEFVQVYPQDKLIPDAKAKTWWRKHVTTDEVANDVLAGAKAWSLTRQYQDGFGYGCCRFLTERIWERPVPQERKPKEEEEPYCPWKGAL